VVCLLLQADEELEVVFELLSVVFWMSIADLNMNYSTPSLLFLLEILLKKSLKMVNGTE